MRRVLLALYLHALLLSRRTIILLMEIYVFAAVVGWAVMGVVIAMWLLPTPVMRALP